MGSFIGEIFELSRYLFGFGPAESMAPERLE
jgi:hypothetical protein